MASTDITAKHHVRALMRRHQLTRRKPEHGNDNVGVIDFDGRNEDMEEALEFVHLLHPV